MISTVEKQTNKHFGIKDDQTTRSQILKTHRNIKHTHCNLRTPIIFSDSNLVSFPFGLKRCRLIDHHGKERNGDNRNAHHTNNHTQLPFESFIQADYSFSRNSFEELL